MIENNQIEQIKLWYDGIGSAFSYSRGYMSRLGCDNSPKNRLIHYIILSLVFILFFIYCLVTAFIIKIFFLTVIFYITGFIALCRAISIINASLKLKNAISSNNDTDLYDPIRLKTIKRAFKWAKMKKYIQKKNDGSYEISLLL